MVAQLNNILLIMNKINTYQTPLVEFIDMLVEGNILSMSGGSVGVKGWDDLPDDFGGDAE